MRLKELSTETGLCRGTDLGKGTKKMVAKNTVATIILSLEPTRLFLSGVKILSGILLLPHLHSYVLVHPFSLTPKSTRCILTGKLSNSHTYQENIPGHPYCLWSGGLTKHKCFICKCYKCKKACWAFKLNFITSDQHVNNSYKTHLSHPHTSVCAQRASYILKATVFNTQLS